MKFSETGKLKGSERSQFVVGGGGVRGNCFEKRSHFCLLLFPLSDVGKAVGGAFWGGRVGVCL